MLQRRSRRFTVILEQQNVLKSPILLQIENAIAKRPQHILNLFRRKRSQGSSVVGRLNHNFVSANPVHLVEHSLGLLVQVAFNTESRKLIRHHPHRPAWSILLRSVAIIARSIRENLRRRLRLIAITKRAESALNLYRLAQKNRERGVRGG